MKQLTITAGEYSMTRLNISTSVAVWHTTGSRPVRVGALGTDTCKTTVSTLETIRRIRS